MTSQIQPQDCTYTDDKTDTMSYDPLLKLSGSVIFTLDAEFRLSQVKGATQDIFGCALSDLIGQDYRGFITEDKRETLQQQLQTHETHQLEYWLVQADNEQLWVRHNSVRHLVQGSFQYQIMLQAMPQQQKVASPISEQDRDLLATLPDMIIIIQQDGMITDFYPSDDTTSLGIDIDIIGKEITSTSLPQPVIDEVMLYLDIDLSSYVQAIEFAQDDTDRTSDHFEARLVRFNDNAIMVLVRNVTMMKRVQDELSRHIEDLNLVRQVNVELSANLNINYVSQLALDAALRLSNAQAGYLAMMQATGQFVIMSQFGPYDPQAIERKLLQREGILARVLATSQPELIPNVHQDDDYVPLLDDTHAMMVIPLRANEETVGVLVLETRTNDRFSRERFQFLQLITGRIAAFLDNAMLHRQKEEQYEEVRQLEQLKTDMIRIANHDLKNPIAGIMGYMELLRFDIEDKLSDRERNYLDRIEEAAKKMQRITTGILSLERINQLSDQQMLKTVNLRDLVNQSVSEQMDYAVQREQTLSRDLPEQDVLVQGDPLQLHEALSNLIQNAIKYTPKQGRVDVSLDIDDSQATVRVVDTGFGIPKDQQGRLFSPFFRANMKETRSIEGTGLGLHLVKNIIERHAGKMLLESEYGEGSTFGFTISIVNAPAQSAQ